MTWRWGKAGVRKDERIGAQRRAQLARRRQAREQQLAEDQEAAYKHWQGGAVVPHRITTALDLRGLYGPEVDKACHAEEPEVDQWEAGELYPRWDQFKALGELTGLPLSFFFVDAEPIPFDATSLGCGRSGGFEPPPAGDPVLEFLPEVVDARMRGEPSPLLPPGQMELF